MPNPDEAIVFMLTSAAYVLLSCVSFHAHTNCRALFRLASAISPAGSRMYDSDLLMGGRVAESDLAEKAASHNEKPDTPGVTA